ncbi:hypothetical protein, partial [Hoylesella shahii]|uniref:hypothetical protein n=1 Tax=Hoylesella shahii TaxID=228603 RepID=UPI002889A36D
YNSLIFWGPAAVMHPVFFVLDTKLLRAISLIFFFPFDGKRCAMPSKTPNKICILMAFYE